MSAYGIASFIDGFFRGREIKHGWEDRADQKKRQKRMDEITEADAAYYKDAAKRAVDATEASFGATPAAGSAPADPVVGVAQELGAIPKPPSRAAEVVTSTMSTEDMQRTYGAQQGQPKAAPAAAPAPQPQGIGVSPVPQPRPAQQVPAQATPPAGPAAAQGPAFEAAGRGAQPAAAGAQPQGDGSVVFTHPSGRSFRIDQTGRVFRDDGAEITDPRVKQLAYDYASGVATPGNASIGVKPDPQHDWGASLPGDAAEVAKRGVGAIGGLATSARDLANAGVRTVTEGVDAGLGYVTGIRPADPNWRDNVYGAPSRPPAQAPAGLPLPQSSPGWNRPAIEQTAGPSADTPANPLLDSAKRYTEALPKSRPGPLIANVPAGTPPANRALADQAVETMAETTTPAVQAASEAATSALGATAKPPVTDAQRAAASKDFIDRYMEVGAPIMIKAMLANGDIDKAIKFQEFLDKGATKASMENWAKAAFAASVGDFDAFADEIVEAYNRLDYFGDDTTIVREQSGFTKDRDGNISGAKITFKDEKTGNTYEQVFEDPSDLMEMGITLLAPEEAFAWYTKKVEAQEAEALGAVKEAEAEAKEAAKDTQKRLDDITKIILEASKDPMGKPTMSYGDARREAERELQRTATPTTAGAPPPVLYRQ